MGTFNGEAEEKGRGAPTSDVTPPPIPERAAVDVARFPKGFWARIDYLLHHPAETIESFRRGADLWSLSRMLFVVALATAAMYGAVMGATNLLQGSEMGLAGKIGMIFITAIKVPVLFLLTLAIVLPAVYVTNAFVGPRLSFPQMLALLLAAFSITGTVLASMASVAFFFSLTSRGYDLIKLLHVLFFIIAGLSGLSFLEKCLVSLSVSRVRGAIRWLFTGWLLLYMFVGTQLAWVLRPFVGSPKMQFEVFRPRAGNFYVSVFESVRELRRETEAPIRRSPPEEGVSPDPASND